MSAIAHISLDEYERIVAAGVFEARRLEFIRGEIREMSPKGNRHEDMVDQLDEWSHEALRGKGVRIRVQNSIRLPSLDTLPEPDLTWVIRHRYSRRKPGPEDIHLVIEVAETSLEYDLGDKAELYAAAGIRDYWVVDSVRWARCGASRPGRRPLPHDPVLFRQRGGSAAGISRCCLASRVAVGGIAAHSIHPPPRRRLPS